MQLIIIKKFLQSCWKIQFKCEDKKYESFFWGEYCGDDSIVINCPLPKVESIGMVAEEKGIIYKVKFPYRCFDELVKKEELSEKMFDFYKKNK